MITSNGYSQQLKLISGKVYKFANLFAVGASGIALPSTATALDFAWASVAITDSYVDEALKQVVFHGTLGSDLAGNISEIGLVSQSDEFVRSGLPNVLVYGFEPTESWFSNIDYEITTNSSIGPNNYKLNNVVADNYLAKIVSNISIARYDTVKMKLISNNVTGVRVILKNDELRYAYKDFTLTNGSNTLSSTVSSFVNVGAFNPNEIFEIRIVVRTTSNATNNIEFDALNLSSQANGGLVARSTLSVVQYKRQGSTMELEMAVAL